MYVPYIEPPTTQMLIEQKEILNEWVQRNKLFFPRDNSKIVIDGSYPLGGNVFDALKSCPFKEIDIEFRFMNVTLFDGESWNSFCTRIKHLKLHKCHMNSSILYGIVMNAKKMTSLRLVLPVISKCDFWVTQSLVQLAPKKRPNLKSLTYCESDVDIFEPFITFLFSIYPHIIDFKIYLKLLPHTPSSGTAINPEGKMFSTPEVCNVIHNRLVASPRKIRSLDLKLFDGSPLSSCQMIPIATKLFVSEFMW